MLLFSKHHTPTPERVHFCKMVMGIRGVAEPAPLIFAEITGHMVAPRGLDDLGLTLGAERELLLLICPLFKLFVHRFLT
jgi:hypothetical protein